jgi:hypothetical protein
MRGHAAWKCDATTKSSALCKFPVTWAGGWDRVLILQLGKIMSKKGQFNNRLSFLCRLFEILALFFFYLCGVVLPSFKAIFFFCFITKILWISYHPAQFNLKQAAGIRIVSYALNMAPSLPRALYLCCMFCRGMDARKRVLQLWRAVSGLCDEDGLNFFYRNCNCIFEYWFISLTNKWLRLEFNVFVGNHVLWTRFLRC